jgi:hypothetical protein
MVKTAPKTDGLYDNVLHNIINKKKERIKTLNDDDLILIIVYKILGRFCKETHQKILW